jgi:ribosome-binding ATPase YchF (GTP1/OBG family)
MQVSKLVNYVCAHRYAILHLVHSRLQLIRYFTCGPDEVRAWTIRKGTKAPQAAGVIQYVIYRTVSALSNNLTTQL